MRLDLRELIVNPERRLPFHLELETGDLDFPSVREYLRPPVADGVVSNEAGILHMRGTITAEMLCVCDRCGQEFESTTETAVDLSDSGHGDKVPLQGGLQRPLRPLRQEPEPGSLRMREGNRSKICCA